MKSIVITGSQSGMGLAFRNDLEMRGYRIIGVDLPGKGAEIEADLSNPESIIQAVQEINKLSGGKLAGVIANAGVDNHNVPLVFGLNFSGVVQLLDGLHPFLAANRGARVVINASNSVIITPLIPVRVVELLNDFKSDEAIAELGANTGGAYVCSKLAIVRWMRNNAATQKWAGNCISMNALAPGAVLTPLLEHDLKDSIKGPMIQALPKPLGNLPRPEDMANIMRFLISEDAKYIVGQLIVADGGMDALWRNIEYPQPWNISVEDFFKKIIAV
jgi:NAD(P)-dependent dehydrogenase (short-subunit alcohol dehydrogenase family)